MKWNEQMKTAKPYIIPKRLVWEAYKCVKANRGAAGVDGTSLKDFEKDLTKNLYKIWNRMSSGSYFPPAVRVVEIPKANGGIRSLGIPTVSDRIAQMVVKMYLEPVMEPFFHKDSYGYRPGRSAIEAVGEARKRCRKYDWVLDLDIKGFFDNLDHELVMKAVRKHTQCKWILLYVERWLRAPAQREDGTIIVREQGTPQGGVISPLLANLFLHYAFDKWMEQNHKHIPFERYADDIVVHCKTEGEAKLIWRKIEQRLEECKLMLHPEKTKVVYCRDANRKREYPEKKFDFLGYTYKPRESKNRRGKLFTNFSPAVGDKAIKKIKDTIRRWKLRRQSDRTLTQIASEINPTIQGWINYYAKYYKSALDRILTAIDLRLIDWARRKYKRFKNSHQRAKLWLAKIRERDCELFAHWRIGLGPKVTIGRAV